MTENIKANRTMPEMKLELVPVPVSDVDRAKAFYEKAGFTLGVDTRPRGHFLTQNNEVN